MDKRTIRRHLGQLEQTGLISRKERPGRPSLLVIEDPSAVETQRYLETFGGGERADKSVRPTPDKSVRPLLEEDKEKEIQDSLTTVKKPSGVGEGGYTRVGDTLRKRVGWLKMNGEKIRSPAIAKREYLVQQMVDVLGDEHSRGCYRRIAELHSPEVIHHCLGAVKEVASAGRVRASRGAHFTSLISRNNPSRH